MYYDAHCLECDHTFNYDLDGPSCPECNSNEIEDLAECICSECGLEIESNPLDPCPECGGELEEI